MPAEPDFESREDNDVDPTDAEFNDDFAESESGLQTTPVQESPGMRRFFSYGFPSIFLLVGIGLLIGGGFVLDMALKSKEWPSVQGMVTRSEVQRSYSSSSGSSHSSLMYSALVTYDYQVNGEKITGDNITFGTYSSSSPKGANQTVKRYPLGEPVKVYYNPKDPWNSVLEPGAGAVSYILLGIGGVFFLLGVVLFLTLPRAFSPPKERS